MSKEEAIEILSEMRSEYNLFGDEEEATRYHVLSWAIRAMNAEHVRHGRWQKPQRHGVISYDEHAYAECSCCHKPQYLARGMNYCPNCGAKMDEVEDG